MNQRHDITDVETGDGFDGKRVAVITAPREAKPGSLQALTRFFHEHGHDAQLGYTGSDKRHVLRLQSLESDAQLEHLLKSDFPQWQTTQEGAKVSISPAMQLRPMGSSPADAGRNLGAMLRDKSTSIAATAYMAGNMGLVFSALYGQKGKKPEMVKLGAPLCYTMASAFLFLLNSKTPEAREMNQIWDEISPQLLRDDFTPTKAEEEQLRRQGNAAVGHVWEFMKKHPWEVSGLINMVGAAAHTASATMRGNATEALSALSTLTAMGITTFVPERGYGNLDATAFKPLHESVSMRSFGADGAHNALVQPFFDAGQKILDWVKEKPLRASSYIQLAANAGYGVAALGERDEHGKRHPDWGLMVSSGTYITGNAFQSIASKNKGPSFDDMVSTAANAIAHQTDWQQQDPATLHERIQRVAQGLAAQPEIGHSQKVLTAGIMERLERPKQQPTPQRELIDGFIATEKDALKTSPFMSPHLVETQRGRDSAHAR